MSDAAPHDSADLARADDPGAEPAPAEAAAIEFAGLQAEPRGEEVANKGDRRFHIGLALAVGLHSLLFAGMYGAPPRHVGDPSGSPDAISVALVTDAELRGLAAMPESAPKGPPVPPTPQPTPQPEPAEAERSPPPPDPPSEAAEKPSPPEPEPPLPSALPDDALTLKPLEEPPLVKEAKPEPKRPPPPKAQPSPSPQQAKPERSRTANLDLSPPTTFSSPFGGGGAGLQRPPGITRSGENDAFARAVVSALQRTMPQLSNTRGRVTVRITLDMNGGVVSTEVVNPSNVPNLDRYVVFATKQTSYPFPPRNAKSADLVFLITYIYN